MNRSLLVLAVLALAVVPAALPSASTERTSTVTVRSADEARVASMRVEVSGAFFAGLGPAADTSGRVIGRVRLGHDGGTATTPAALSVGDALGSVTFSAPTAGPELEVVAPNTPRVRGHVVRVFRDRDGQAVRVERVR